MDTEGSDEISKLKPTSSKKKLVRSKTITEKVTPKNRDAVVKCTDMPEELQREAIGVATDAMNKFRLEKDMATYIKEEFDRRHSPSWHCVVGRNFGR
ncbi:hypothetical protein WR25_02835 [Diploscapter pachys]|uniref:Dynein light chain n=1 Tax=Diploscapter pachys TaxID=2018661 RepID=A0A2A2K205_9BILA|nr:hypothetical protein WR25_02835 [Diploscapter pachys]